jgi:hypothetical protein
MPARRTSRREKREKVGRVIGGLRSFRQEHRY